MKKEKPTQTRLSRNGRRLRKIFLNRCFELFAVGESKPDVVFRVFCEPFCQRAVERPCGRDCQCIHICVEGDWQNVVMSANLGKQMCEQFFGNGLFFPVNSLEINSKPFRNALLDVFAAFCYRFVNFPRFRIFFIKQWRDAAFAEFLDGNGRAIRANVKVGIGRTLELFF